ncbi:hypothetical protein OOZ15_08055 [Galbibacter sp. EGI 63066]|uniref:hypothetical protein n=1 Tax=Galbibacter sp. EGI 63066 TaxID=2993559 RepID=UPI0022498CE7|nr:hypothetical protein [Galbibacter sp. EGI 63066]MCX2679885.1 hypothetical protein [Galbibacter sp. EGI 63066]
MKNVIQTSLTEKDKSQVDELITKLEDLLKGKLSALTEQERIKYGSINEQNKLFVNKVNGYVQTTPTLCAPEVDWEDFKKDYNARLFLESRTERLQSLAFQMESTKMMHDYDNFRDALIDYNYAQYKKGAGENGYTEKVAELRQFFPRGNRKNGDKTIE